MGSLLQDGTLATAAPLAAAAASPCASSAWGAASSRWRTWVDHVTPGDWNAFVTGEPQSLCEPCHKSAKRQIELRGYTVTSGSTATRPIRIIRSIGQDSSAD